MLVYPFAEGFYIRNHDHEVPLVGDVHRQKLILIVRGRRAVIAFFEMRISDSGMAGWEAHLCRLYSASSRSSASESGASSHSRE
jgi:hypothetical protein